MNRILVPTDFSNCAMNALRYAVAIANRFGSEILLYHAFKMRITSRTFVSVDALLREEAEEKLQKIITQMKPQLEGSATIDGLAVRGDVIPAIAQRAEKESFDLIVMGTEGASSIQGLVMGSTTVGVLEDTEVPVLAVPREASFQGLRSIVLALDEKTVKKADTLKPLVQIAQAFDLSIKVYHKTDPDHPRELSDRIDSFLNDVPHAYYYEVNEMDINEGILLYARQEMADLLCLIRRKRNFLQKMFQRSITRENVLQGQVPLLILKE